jgi:predicted amidohydrolase
MGPSPIRIAALQLRAHDRTDFARSLDGIIDAVRAAAADADLIVLPEATFPAYVLGEATVDGSAVAGALERLRDIAIATRTVVVAGAVTQAGGILRNGAIVIDADGSTAGRADKLFLWHFDRRWFARGQRLDPIATAVGVLGVLVCADGRLPTIARALVDRGAQALVMPTAWVTSGRDPSALENVQADLLARVRAYENGVPFVAANKCGSELGMVAYCGKSQIVGSDGEMLALADEQQPQTITATIALRGAQPRRTKISRPAPRAAPIEAAFRLAISFEPLAQDIDRRLELLDDAYALAPHESRCRALLDEVLPIAGVDDELVLDPGGLVEYRRAGYRLILWNARLGAPWTERIARARALELRVYVVVFDEAAKRAFAVDPDGAIVAGTFDGYRLASFLLDPSKAAQTAVAPGTDIGEGLEHVAEITERATTAR